MTVSCSQHTSCCSPAFKWSFCGTRTEVWWWWWEVKIFGVESSIVLGAVIQNVIGDQRDGKQTRARRWNVCGYTCVVQR